MILIPDHLPRLEVEVAIYTEDETLKNWRIMLSKEYGWKEGDTIWSKKTAIGVIHAKVFYRQRLT